MSRQDDKCTGVHELERRAKRYAHRHVEHASWASDEGSTGLASTSSAAYYELPRVCDSHAFDPSVDGSLESQELLTVDEQNNSSQWLLRASQGYDGSAWKHCIGGDGSRHSDSSSELDSSALSDADTDLELGLQMGSNDPHCLRLNDDRAPHIRRKATYSVAGHLAASDAELRRRELPILNAAQSTDPLPPPTASPPPPDVWRVEQIIPRSVLSRVRTWMRRLRRCLRAARRGDASLARRLRPDDLWISADEGILPEMRPWNWDLRPLACGGRAVAWNVSGVDGVQPHTDLVLAAFGVDDSDFVDQAIISEMKQGIRDDSECERGTLLCAPHGSALRLFDVAQGKLDANVTKGWATGGWELPCWPLRTYPYGLVDESERAGEPKHRLTSDLSWPQAGMLTDSEGKTVSSVNGAMRRDDWPTNRLMRVHEISESAAILCSASELVELWGVDATAYYRAFGRQLSELWRNACIAEDGVQVDERCCFGSAADASKCSRASNYFAWQSLRALRAIDERYPSHSLAVLEWQAARRAAGRAAGATDSEIESRWAALHFFGYYIDDGAGGSISDLIFESDGTPLLRDGVQVRRAQLHFEAIRATLVRFGLVSAPRKEQPPSQQLTTLGVHLDLTSRRMRVTEDKRVRYASKVDELLQSTTCKREHLIALLGRLQFAASCYPLGRQWLHAPWRAARAQYRLADGMVMITNAVRKSLQRWATELRAPEHEGVPLARRAMRPMGESGVGAIYADASGSIGYTAWTVAKGELLYVEGEWSREQQRELLICDKELIASTLGLVALAPEAQIHDVYSFTDNTVAQAVMKSLRPSTAAMQLLVQRRSQWLVESGRLEAAERITSKANRWADLGSRGQLATMIREARSFGLVARRVPLPSGWQSCAADALRAAREAVAQPQ